MSGRLLRPAPRAALGAGIAVLAVVLSLLVVVPLASAAMGGATSGAGLSAKKGHGPLLDVPEPTPEPGESVIYGVVKSGATDEFLDDVTVQAVGADGPVASALTYATSLTYASSLTYEGDGYQHGFFALYVPPGDYRITFTPSEDQRNVRPAEITGVTVAADEAKDLDITTLEAATGVGVEVRNATFSGWLEGATVTLTAEGEEPQTRQTDNTGYAYFGDVEAGATYDVQVAKDQFLPVTDSVDYDGDFLLLDYELEADLRCVTGAEPHDALTNMGFEDGLDGWTLGHQTEGVTVVGADAYTSPWEGSSMARFGTPRGSDDDNQPEGPNILCQDFVATEDSESLAFNVFTFDYTGFDEFNLEMAVLDDDGDVLASYTQGSWGTGTDLKTSGWRTATIDTSDHVGETLHLVIRAGGTSDDLYAFWVYVDSAENREAPPVNVDVQAESETGSVNQDPVTGQFTVAFPGSAPSDLTMTFPGECAADGVEPTSVTLLYGGDSYVGTEIGTTGTYTATIPEADIATTGDGTLVVQVTCPSETTQVTTIGEIVLYDPSGFVTDAVTGDPVVGAEVRLHKVPSWTPKTDAIGPLGPNQCHTNESKGGSAWSQAAPVALGVLVSAASPEISPNVNPFLTNAAGYYGWNVATGCWYVTVSAAGYVDLVSPVVGVPTEVTDLDLQLTRTPSPGGGGGGGGGGATAPTATVAPSIGGVAKVGKSLTATPGTWTASGLTYGYQWLRAGSPIQGATSASYTAVVADLGKALTVRVTTSGAGLPAGTATSAPVTIGVGDAPEALSTPVITGTPRPGKELEVSPGTWSLEDLEFGYQWLRDGTPVAGATGPTYDVTDADAGSAIGAVVTATRSGYAQGSAEAAEVEVTLPGQPGEVRTTTTAALADRRIKVGQRGDLLVTVARSDGKTAAGKVTIRVDGKVFQVVELGPKGKVSVDLPRLPKGVHRIEATYRGGAGAKSSTSEVVKLTVTKKHQGGHRI